MIVKQEIKDFFKLTLFSSFVRSHFITVAAAAVALVATVVNVVLEVGTTAIAAAFAKHWLYFFVA